MIFDYNFFFTTMLKNEKTSHQVLVTHETFQSVVVYYIMILVDILTRICVRHFELCIWLKTRTHLNSQFV